eukprot:363637-Chlamydomonas_euryale.AAC.9
MPRQAVLCHATQWQHMCRGEFSQTELKDLNEEYVSDAAEEAALREMGLPTAFSSTNAAPGRDVSAQNGNCPAPAESPDACSEGAEANLPVHTVGQDARSSSLLVAAPGQIDATSAVNGLYRAGYDLPTVWYTLGMHITPASATAADIYAAARAAGAPRTLIYDVLATHSTSAPHTLLNGDATSPDTGVHGGAMDVARPQSSSCASQMRESLCSSNRHVRLDAATAAHLRKLLPRRVAKYWLQRYSLFSRFDAGVQLDTEVSV